MNRTQLADAMLKGKNTPGVEENRGNYISSREIINACFACALGCALIGKHDGDYLKAEEVYDARFKECNRIDFEHEIFADLLGVPSKLAFMVESKHLNGLSIEDIAKWLKGGEAS